jgi:hypothetical protein
MELLCFSSRSFLAKINKARKGQPRNYRRFLLQDDIPVDLAGRDASAGGHVDFDEILHLHFDDVPEAIVEEKQKRY